MNTDSSYIDGFILPVPTAKLDEYRRVATIAAGIWREHGALHYQECAADDMNIDFCRSFIEMTGAGDDETVIFAWAAFASREARDAANLKIMADERLKALCTASEAMFDSKRMAFGGFKTIVQA